MHLALSHGVACQKDPGSYPGNTAIGVGKLNGVRVGCRHPEDCTAAFWADALII